MPVQSNETKAANLIRRALDVQELAPHSLAYMIKMLHPRMQKRFWDICLSFMYWVEEDFQRGVSGDAEFNSMQIQVHEIMEAVRPRP